MQNHNSNSNDIKPINLVFRIHFFLFEDNSCIVAERNDRQPTFGVKTFNKKLREILNSFFCFLSFLHVIREATEQKHTKTQNQIILN